MVNTNKILEIFKEELRIAKNQPLRINKENQHALEEGWKENIIALATAAAGLVGSAKGQDNVLQKLSPKPQTTLSQQSKDTLRLDFNTTFKSGRYTFSKENLQDLAQKFESISQFIKQHPNANFKINVVASESKVPNYDLEQSSPTFKQKLNSGELANKRAEAIRIALSTFENNLRSEGIKFGKMQIQTPQTLIGGPEWGKGENINDPKFVQHQYVKIEIIAETPQQQGFNFTAFASEDESMFDNQRHLTARVFNRTRETQNIKQSGNVDTGHEDVLIRFVNGNTGKFTGENYLLNSAWWNKNRGTSTLMTSELAQKIKDNGKKI